MNYVFLYVRRSSSRVCFQCFQSFDEGSSRITAKVSAEEALRAQEMHYSLKQEEYLMHYVPYALCVPLCYFYSPLLNSLFKTRYAVDFGNKVTQWIELHAQRSVNWQSGLCK